MVMDVAIRREVQRVEPEVPFRAVTLHRHATWARTWHSRPELYIQPESVAEVQKAVTVARRCRRRVVAVGAAHSPSDLTCTSSWKVNLDRLDRVLSVSRRTGVVVMQAGIRLHALQAQLRASGLALPNSGSITDQSIAGAIATGTHGSSLRHGLLSEAVLGLKLVLANGSVVSCSREQNVDLFRAALVSLGALGIVVEVTFRAVPDFKIAWTQNLVALDSILDSWDDGLWTDHEFVRVWWMPYQRKCIHWSADKTDAPIQEPRKGLMGGKAGFHIYQFALWIANWVPRLIPLIEGIVCAVQYGRSTESAVQDASRGLQMDCLFSQFVNEWAIPLERGPEALTRLSAWLHGDYATANIPFSSKGLYVHAPIEVRVSHTSRAPENGTEAPPRPYLDNTVRDGPTLYLNATLYRPYHSDPPAHLRYYEAFEHLMRELGGRPHWAKNFLAAAVDDATYPDLGQWLRVREQLDPDGMFFGDWHRRNLLPAAGVGGSSGGEDGGKLPLPLPLEERRVRTTPNRLVGGHNYWGEVWGRVLSPQASEESFDLMAGAEAEKSMMLEGEYSDDE